MIHRLRHAWMALSLLATSALAQDVARPTVGNEVSAAELERTVRVLASDAFEGRDLGSAGSRAAAYYCAAELERFGLEPIGADRSFLQPVVLYQLEYSAPPRVVLTLESGETAVLESGVDFALRVSGLAPEVGVLDVVYAVGEDEVTAAARTDVALGVLASPSRARRWVEDDELDGRRPPVVLIPGGDRRGRPTLPGRAGGVSFDAAARADSMRVTLLGPWSEALEGRTVRRVEVEPNLVLGEIDDMNTVGLLRGAGTPERPELAEEFIVVSAHRDHIGIQSIGRAGATEEDRIANGADDDASGCAVLLELARCLAESDRPARSVVFLLVTGEERGLLGSRYYVENPLVPIEATVANLNLEMLGLPDAAVGGHGRTWLTGFERSDLGSQLVEAGIDVQADPRPNLNLFVRSDNVSFARVGIVAHTLSTYGENPNYHQVRDEADTLDYAHMRDAAEVALAALRELASGRWTPTWDEDEPRLGR